MISIIICSRKADISQELKDNIASTIGCEYELCVIDNSHNDYNIFTAYNEGVRRAKGDIFCFMHEDILYHTENWGINVEKRFKNDSRLGLIGNLGSHILPKVICGVGDSMILSSNYYTKGKENHFCDSKYFEETGAVEVVVVDGMWYCIRATLFSEKRLKYDESYSGFHYYDMDISMQVWTVGYSCKVVNDVLLEHFSAGPINNVFLQNSRIFYNKWKSTLPMIKGASLSDNEILLATRLCEAYGYNRELMYYLEKYKYSIGYKIKQILKQLLCH